MAISDKQVSTKPRLHRRGKQSISILTFFDSMAPQNALGVGVSTGTAAACKAEPGRASKSTRQAGRRQRWRRQRMSGSPCADASGTWRCCRALSSAQRGQSACSPLERPATQRLLAFQLTHCASAPRCNRGGQRGPPPATWRFLHTPAASPRLACPRSVSKCVWVLDMCSQEQRHNARSTWQVPLPWRAVPLSWRPCSRFRYSCAPSCALHCLFNERVKITGREDVRECRDEQGYKGGVGFKRDGVKSGPAAKRPCRGCTNWRDRLEERGQPTIVAAEGKTEGGQGRWRWGHVYLSGRARAHVAGAAAQKTAPTPAHKNCGWGSPRGPPLGRVGGW